VTAGAHCGQQIVAPRECDRTDNILLIDTSRDDRRSTIDGMIPDAARFCVLPVTGDYDFAGQRRSKFSDRLDADFRKGAGFRRSIFHGLHSPAKRFGESCHIFREL